MSTKNNERVADYGEFFGHISMEEFEEIDPMANYTVHAAAAAAAK